MTNGERNGLIFVYALAFFLIVGMAFGHTFKKNPTSGNWIAIEAGTGKIILNPNQTLSIGNSDGTILDIIDRPQLATLRFDRDNKGIIFGTMTADPVGQYAFPNSRSITFRNTANTTYVNSLFLDSDNDLRVGNINEELKMNSVSIGNQKIVSVDASDSCGIGFRCLRVTN